MEEPLYKEQQKEKNQDGYIQVNKKDPELILAPKKEDKLPPPGQQKKDFQVRKLSGDLRKKRKVMSLNSSLRSKLYHPEVYHPKSANASFAVPEEMKRDYEEEKKDNLKRAAIAQNTIAKSNVETDKKIARVSKNDNETMKLILKKLETAAAVKQKYMLSLSSDPSETEYIKLCVELDKLMKLRSACGENMKDEASKNKALADIDKLIQKTTGRLQKVTENKAPEQKKKKTKTETSPETKKPETVLQKPETVLQKPKTVTQKPKTVTQKPKTVTQKPKTVLQKPERRLNENLNQPDGGNDKRIAYTNPANGVQYYFVKEEPKNLMEALNLRGQISKNFDVANGGCPIELVPLYTYYQEFVERFAATEEIQYPPDYLEKVDVSGYPLEVVVALRNRFTDGGILYADLKGKAKELYDYYDGAVKHLIATDGTMKERVDQHEARKKGTKKLLLKTNLDKEYERQVPGSNDCWSCAGSAILNHFLRKEPNYKKTTQEEIRSFRPKLKKQEEMGVDSVTYNINKAEIDAFTINNRKQSRVGSKMGNPYMVADFYLKKLSEAGKKNTAVRKMVFQPGLASRQMKGLKDKEGKLLGKDTNALHNLREKFKETVLEALRGDSALTLLTGLHYLTIVGIDGDKLIVHNSSSNTPGVTETRDISSVLGNSEGHKAVELVWLQKIEDPKEITRKYKNLSYDENKKEFHEKVKNFSENIGQTSGVGAWKTLEEKDQDISDLIMDGIYLPKTFEG